MTVASRYSELAEAVTTENDFYITDLRVLNASIDNKEPRPAPFSFEGSILPRIASLSITLSQPLQFFKAIETNSLVARENQGHASSSKPEGNSYLSIWSQLSSRPLIQLPHLRKFHMWLDHYGEVNWSMVNERVIPALMEALKTRKPKLKLVCALPKVHPRIEGPQRHYLPGKEDEEAAGGEESSSPLWLHRTPRQRHRVVGESGNLNNRWITYVQDFPHSFGDPLFYEGRSRAEREELEAFAWRRGVDIVALSSPRCCIRYSRRRC